MAENNKDVVRRLNKAFEAGDNDAIVALLHDDII